MYHYIINSVLLKDGRVDDECTLFKFDSFGISLIQSECVDS